MHTYTHIFYIQMHSCTRVHTGIAAAGKADLVQQARLLSAQTLSQARVLVPADPGVKRMQAIIYGQLQRAMLGQLSSAAALLAAEKEWNAYAAARWP